VLLCHEKCFDLLSVVVFTEDYTDYFIDVTITSIECLDSSISEGHCCSLVSYFTVVFIQILVKLVNILEYWDASRIFFVPIEYTIIFSR
jgi:hypothetical protein